MQTTLAMDWLNILLNIQRFKNMNKYAQKFVVVGSDEELKEFVTLMAVIKTLCMNGSSREISLDVDGDGSANLNFWMENDEDTLDLTDEKYLELPLLTDEILPSLKNGSTIELSIGE